MHMRGRPACLIVAALALGGLAGCESLGMSTPSLPSVGGLTRIFDKEEKPLAGKRVSLLKEGSATEATGAVEVTEAFAVPPPRESAAWMQPGGVASNAPGHLAYSGGARTAWREDVGEGSSKRGRLTAVPVVDGPRVYSLDTEGVVTAFSTSGGATVWRVSLKPDKEKGREGYGGGLAVEGDKLYAATGFGTVVALEAATGKTAWTKQLQVPVRSSPTVYNGRIYVVNVDSQVYCLSAADGAQIWEGRGLPESATLISNVSPAVAGDTLVVSYPSGDIQAFDPVTGAGKWSESLKNLGGVASTLNSVGDPARPVIDGDMVVAVSQAGRMIASNRKTGERVWSRDIAAKETPWVAGDTVYVVDTAGSVHALKRKDGKLRWKTALPDSRAWTGPVLAGGKLWLASSKGRLVGVDAQSGQIAAQGNVDGAVYITPVVAGGRMYVMTDAARLVALN